MPENERRQPGDRGLLWIGGFKLLQGIAFAIFALGLLRFLHADLAALVEDWKDMVHFESESGFIAEMLRKLSLVTDKEIKLLSGITFVFAGVFLTEGVGLLMKKRWAEYLTVIATGSLIPYELYETFTRFALVKLLLLVVNVVIVWFLIRVLKRQAAG